MIDISASKKAFTVPLVAMFGSYVVTSNYFVFREFGEFLTTDMINFVWQAPNYLLAYHKTYLDVYLIATLIVLGLVFGLIIYRGRQQESKTLFFRMIVVLGVLLVSLNYLNLNYSHAHLSLETSTALALRNVFFKKSIGIDRSL